MLVSARSISAAEIAADALQSTGRAQIVGKKTPGVVLSSRLFDIPGGFHPRVPIADYHSIRNGRLEGAGRTPDIPVTADRALDVALQSHRSARRARSRMSVLGPRTIWGGAALIPALFGLYELSGADVIRRLTLLRTATIGVGSLFLFI